MKRYLLGLLILKDIRLKYVGGAVLCGWIVCVLPQPIYYPLSSDS